MAAPVPAVIARLIGSKNFRKAVAGGAAAVGAYFATKTKPKPVAKNKAIKRSMRWNKDVATTTEKKATGKMAAFNKKMKAGQRKSNLHRKPKRTY